MVKHLLFAIAALASAASAVFAEPLRVGTYNIRTSRADKDTPNAWEARKGDLAALVKGMNLDVFGLQEVRADQDEFFKAEFPGYAFVGERTVPGDDRMCSVPVAYRKDRFECEKSGTFWLSETPDEKGSKSWDSAEPRVCSYAVLRDKASGRRFCFANCHLDHKGHVAREKGALLIAERMKDFGSGAPVVFVGDHNSNETEPAAKSLSKVLANALYLSEKAPAGAWRTHNGWRWRDREVMTAEALKMSVADRNAFPGSPDKKKKSRRNREKDKKAYPFYDRCGGTRIDFIYVTSGTRVIDYATLNDTRPGKKLYPSDHFPIVATVEFPEAKAAPAPASAER